MTTVLIVEDHALFREGLKVLLSTTPEFELVAETASADEAVRLARELRPGLVLMDIQLGEEDGLAAVATILEADPEIRILMLTMFDDDRSVFEALRSGALGYMLKGSSPDELLRSMQAVANGEAIFSKSVAGRMQRYFAVRADAKISVFPELTEREHEVLATLALGLSNSEIARRLQLKPKTVRNHLSNIVGKLHVANRIEAAQRARDRGL